MGKIKARIIDRNRYSKKYPLVRAPRRATFQGDADMEIEVISVPFVNQSEKDAFFETPYPDANYRVLLSPRDTTDSDSSQVVLSVDDVLSDVSKVRIAASAPFTGTVDVVVIRIS